MDEINSSTPEISPSPNPEPPQEPLERVVTEIFLGPNGIRAGWRLLIFLIIVACLEVLLSVVVMAVTHRRVTPPEGELTPQMELFGEGILFLSVLLAAWIMSKMERRRIADYGLPIRQAFRGQFWQGVAIGFASITALLCAMRLAGVFHFGSLALQGAAIWKYAAAWALAFLVVGFFEEFSVRGYPLFTLTTGMTFWPSAILLSIFFGLGHRGNSGEDWVGVATAGGVGLLFALLLRRTGNLWMPIGFHAAWDWGQTYFYGVADSGLIGKGHLLNSTTYGPRWLSGGSVGPEGSWLCVFLLIILAVIFAIWLPEAKYPSAEAVARRPAFGAPAVRPENLPSMFPPSAT
jgi:membrane protease YdiL (CAAX protease family)